MSCGKPTRSSFLGPEAFVFGTPSSAFQGEFRTAWETLLLLANGRKPERNGAHRRVQRSALRAIDLHWHDLRHEAACRWLAAGLDIRAIQLLFGHADLKTAQRYLNVTDAELLKVMQDKLWTTRPADSDCQQIVSKEGVKSGCGGGI